MTLPDRCKYNSADNITCPFADTVDSHPVIMELAEKLWCTNADFTERLMVIADHIKRFAIEYKDGKHRGIK
jgi:hypothetical protein